MNDAVEANDETDGSGEAFRHRISRQKRPRYLTACEESFRTAIQRTNDVASSPGTLLGMADLFGCDRSNGRNKPGLGGPESAYEGSNKPGSPTGGQDDDPSEPKRSSHYCPDFYTLRLEHRIDAGRNMDGQHYGEERLLLFRSDQAGAIAKIIFSSSIPPLPNTDACKEEKDALPLEIIHEPALVDFDDGDIVKGPVILRRKHESTDYARARIHSLFVKREYRGFDLGGLLFCEAMGCLKEGMHRHASSLSTTATPTSIIMECRLDAEEDIRRHNKLLLLYEGLGCRVRYGAKINLVHNNDGESYRKIPMQINLAAKIRAGHASFTAVHESRSSLSVPSPCGRLVSDGRGAENISSTPSSHSFSPIVFRSSSRRRVEVNDKMYAWILVETGDGCFFFQTTRGGTLQARTTNTEDPIPCTIGIPDRNKESSDRRVNNVDPLARAAFNGDAFQLLRLSDLFTVGKEDRDSEADCRHKQKSAPHDLWVVRSKQHGSFLGVDSFTRQTLCTSTRPSFWHFNRHSLSLVLSDSTPSKWEHYRRFWSKQCVSYVMNMRQRYATLDRGMLTIKEALDLSKLLPADPFTVSLSSASACRPTPSLRALLFATAELARSTGHPDWVQFVALIHGLATVLKFIDFITDAESNSDFDWTISVDSAIVGCTFPETSTHSELHCFSPDSGDSRYQSVVGRYKRHIGLENVLLSWTGNEYLYYMLKNNNDVVLPDDAYSLLKLYPLLEWHSNGFHSVLANEVDNDLKQSVKDFYGLCQTAHLSLSVTQEEMSQDRCDYLWKTHYSLVARKYGACDSLRW